jgi:uncharacterized RDD family membrane protein YckC
MLDSVLRVATPEGVELTLRLAGPVPRALAWLIDLLWRFAAFIAILMLVVPLGRFGGGLALLAAFLLEWLVPAWCEVYLNGATPGKKALQLMVLCDDGSPVSWGPALTRNLLRFADFLPFLYAGGLVAMLFNAQFKRLGDLAAGTVVVYADAAYQARVIPHAEPIAPNVPLNLEDRRAVLDFAERAPVLGAARAAELAQAASPLLGGREGAAAVEHLTGIANYLHGKREGEVRHAAG